MSTNEGARAVEIFEQEGPYRGQQVRMLTIHGRFKDIVDARAKERAEDKGWVYAFCGVVAPAVPDRHSDDDVIDLVLTKPLAEAGAKR